LKVKKANTSWKNNQRKEKSYGLKRELMKTNKKKGLRERRGNPNPLKKV